jgi:hypothetical protein
VPPSPVKRYRQKSRLRRGDAGADLRQRALDMAQKGLRQQAGEKTVDPRRTLEQRNHRGGPVDKGSPAAQVQAAKPMQGEKKVARDAGLRRSFQLRRNATGNARSGQTFRTIAAPGKGGEYHEYGGPGGRRVFVRKPAASRTTGPTEGTDNRIRPATRGSEDLANQLAAQRASQNRPKARRKLFSRA